MDKQETEIIEKVIKNVFGRKFDDSSLSQALALLHSDFCADGQRFSWRGFCSKVSKDVLDIKSNDLYHEIIRENVAVRSGTTPQEAANSSVTSVQSDQDFALLTHVWLCFFREISFKYKSQLNGVLAEKWGQDLNKKKLLTVDAGNWVNSLMNGTAGHMSVPSQRVQVKAINDSMYAFACLAFNPVDVDKAIASAVNQVQTLPVAAGMNLRQVLF